MNAVIQQVAFMPDAKFNSLILSALMKKRWNMIDNGEDIVMKKGDTEFKFNILKVNTPK